jgi:hypothetical protein
MKWYADLLLVVFGLLRLTGSTTGSTITERDSGL